jgi:hypothetical protein
LSFAELVVGVVTMTKLNMPRAAGTCNSGVMSVVSKALTIAVHAVCHGVAVVDSSLGWSVLERFSFNRDLGAGQLLLWSKISVFLSVHEGLCGAGKRARHQSPVVLRMLRSGDNRLQTSGPNTLLPNYWANCLLIQQLLLALCVAEDGLTGAQWRPGCPR